MDVIPVTFFFKKSNSRIGDLLILSTPWERWTEFGANNFSILWEVSRTLHDKYEGPLYAKNKVHNFS
jgi:hypothetical protein